MLGGKHFLITAIYLIVGCSSCTKVITLESLLEEMITREHLSYFPKNQYSLHQFSSYNRKSVSPEKEGWFANQDMSHFIRVEENNGHREFVMFDTNGPGAIVRWWMTFYIAQDGILRIYLDNDPIPIIQGPPNKILSGLMLTEPPFAVSVHQGVPVSEIGRDMDHNFYLPVPFAKHCKITYECDSLKLTAEGNYFPDVFYNINYRLYPEKTNLESFSLEALSQAKPLLDKAKHALLNDNPKSHVVKDFEEELLPGDSISLAFYQNGSAVNYVQIEISATDSLQALRSTVLSASFDSKQTVWAPVGEFFGTGYKFYPHKTWMNQTTEGGLMESRWIMPFQKNCQLTFTNFGKETVRIKGKAGLAPYQWKSNSMYFCASFREYFHISTRNEQDDFLDLNFVGINGKGLYVGDQVTVFNTSYQWWGEGDEKIFVDAEAFPSSFGTGTEDYYGYAFGRPNPFSHPFISQPVGEGNEGNSSNGGLTVNMRHRSLDAIPFNSSISSNMELWHWAKAPVNYALTSYWYAQLPFEQNIKSDIDAVRNQVARSTKDFIENVKQ